MITKIEELKKLLSGKGNERHGISIGLKVFLFNMEGDPHFFDATPISQNGKPSRVTLIYCEKRYGWAEDETHGWTEKLEEQVSENDAAYLLRYGRFEKDAGEV